MRVWDNRNQLQVFKRLTVRKYLCVVSQEYLKEEGGLSPEAVRMIGDLLNEQSLMHLALTEMIYIQSDVSDSTKYDWLHFCAFTFVLKDVTF